jgi:predicted ATPase
MFQQLRLENFRGLRELTLTGLGRVNLLVGANNCGKTSVLEAIHILAARDQPWALWQHLIRRGETRDGEDEIEVEVAHIVHGHEIQLGSSFSVSGTYNDHERRVTATFVARPPKKRKPEVIVSDSAREPSLPAIALDLKWSEGQSVSKVQMQLTRNWGLSAEALNNSVGPRRFVPRRVSGEIAPTLFITTEGLTREAVVELFDETVLTPEEAVVLEALHTIEPSIERIATVGSSRMRMYGHSRGGIAILAKGKRIPIGTMGDGIWRLLGIAVALVRSQGGILLVDEIDTGLHYSVLVKMWTLVLAVAKRLDVQVFATTHSRDCYEALADVTKEGQHDVSLQRIEHGKTRAIPFGEAEIRQAALRGIEVR